MNSHYLNGVLHMTRPSENWMCKAACKGHGTDEFFPPDSSTDNERRALLKAASVCCNSCTVSTECGQYADELGIDHGVWGGMSPTRRRKTRERKDKLRKHGIYV